MTAEPPANRKPTLAELEADRIGFLRNLADDGTTPTTGDEADRLSYEARRVAAVRPAVVKLLDNGLPPVTCPDNLDVLRADGLRPFAIWAHTVARYIDTPTVWARDGARAVRQWAERIDTGVKLRDSHGRKASQRTRDVYVAWSGASVSDAALGCLRADEQPWPRGEVCVECGFASAVLGRVTTAHAPRCSLASAEPSVCIATGAPIAPSTSPTVDDWLALYTAAKQYGDEPRAVLCREQARAETLKNTAASAVIAPKPLTEDVPLHELIAFEVVRGIAPGSIACSVTAPPRALSYREGRALVYRLAAAIEAAPGMGDWSAVSTVYLVSDHDDRVDPSNVRGSVTVTAQARRPGGGYDTSPLAAREMLTKAAAAVRAELRAAAKVVG